MSNFEHRLLKHNLNLDYDKNINYEFQTDRTLNSIMNNFIEKNKENFQNKIFILEYQDNIFGILTYYILKNIQGVYPFKLKVCGKIKKTKKLFYNKKDIIKKWRIKHKKNLIFINCFNPLYYVKFSKEDFNDLSNSISIINKFTPEQFSFLIKFFNLNKEKYRDILEPVLYGIEDEIFSFYKKNYKEKYLFAAKPSIKIWHLKGTEEDFSLYDEILKTEDKTINLYACPKENEDFLICNLNSYINSRNSIIKRYNLNLSEEEIIKLLKEKEEYYAKNFYS